MQILVGDAISMCRPLTRPDTSGKPQTLTEDRLNRAEVSRGQVERSVERCKRACGGWAATWRRLGGHTPEQPKGWPQQVKTVHSPRRAVDGVPFCQAPAVSLRGWVLTGSDVCVCLCVCLKNNEWGHELGITGESHFVCRPNLSKHACVCISGRSRDPEGKCLPV